MVVQGVMMGVNSASPRGPAGTKSCAPAGVRLSNVVPEAVSDAGNPTRTASTACVLRYSVTARVIAGGGRGRSG